MKYRASSLLLVLTLMACGPRVKPAHTEPVTVKVVRVQARTEFQEASYVGRVEPVGSTTLLAPYSGTLVEFNVKEGQRVSKGQVLARVYSESVKAAYDAAKASLNQAQDGFDRLQKLKDGGAVAEVKIVEVETQLSQAKSAVNAARKAVEDGQVKAPFSGVAAGVQVQKGVQVTALQPLVQVLDNAGFNIHFPVPEAEMPRLKTDAALEVEVPALGKTFQARLTTKGVVASALSHSYDCVGYVQKDPSLLPGMVCKVRVKVPGSTRILVPASALKVGEQGRYAWCVEDGRVVRKSITVGGYSGRNVVVEDGLAEGDFLIVEGARKVSTGMKVKMVE